MKFSHSALIRNIEFVPKLGIIWNCMKHSNLLMRFLVCCMQSFAMLSCAFLFTHADKQKTNNLLSITNIITIIIIVIIIYVSLCAVLICCCFFFKLVFKCGWRLVLMRRMKDNIMIYQDLGVLCPFFRLGIGNDMHGQLYSCWFMMTTNVHSTNVS